nr:transposase [Paenibacillus larvae]
MLRIPRPILCFGDAFKLEADRYERTENRKAYRNGSYLHGLHTRVGTITLKVFRASVAGSSRQSSLVVTKK